MGRKMQPQIIKNKTGKAVLLTVLFATIILGSFSFLLSSNDSILGNSKKVDSGEIDINPGLQKKVQQTIDYDGNLVYINESYLWQRTQTSEVFKNPDGTMTTYLGGNYMDSKEKRYPVYKEVTDVVNMTVTDDGYNLKWYDEELEIKLKVKEKNKESKEIKEFKEEKTQTKENRILENKKENYHFYWELEDLDSKSSGKSKNTKFKDIEEFEIVLENKTEMNITIIDNRFILEDGLEINLRDLIDTNFTVEESVDEKVKSFKVKPDETKNKDLDKSKIVLDPVVTFTDSWTDSDDVLTDDSYVNSGSTSINYDGEDWNRYGYHSGTGVYRSYWNYNIGLNIQEINSASVGITSRGGTGNLQNFTIHTIYSNSSWTEEALTWANQPCGSTVGSINSTYCNSTYADIGVINLLGGNTFDITSIAESVLVNNSIDDMGFMVKIDNEALGSSNYHYEVQKESAFHNPAFNNYPTPTITLNYTPITNIISPTPSQAYTQDSPTTYFDLETTINMDTCYWHEDGVNHTVTKFNSTKFNMTNTSMIDGPHTVSFFCNKTSDGTWIQTENVSFDVDSVNVSVCRDLTISRDYFLQGDISEYIFRPSTSNDDVECLDILNNSITLEGNGHGINITSNDWTGSGAVPNIIAINDIGNNNTVVRNITIKVDDDEVLSPSGIMVWTNGLNSTYSHISTFLDYYAIRLYGSDSNFSNIVTSNTNDGIDFAGTRNNYFDIDMKATDDFSIGTSYSNFSNITANYANYDDYSGVVHDNLYYNIYLSGSFSANAEDSNPSNIHNDKFIDSIFTSDITIYEDGTPGYWYGVTFLNTTFPDINVDANVWYNYTKSWHSDISVNDSSGYLEGANVTIYDSSSSVIYSALTDSSGDIDNQELIEYIEEKDDIKTYHTPHNVTISKDGYVTNSTEYNISELQNLVLDISLVADIFVYLNSPSNETSQTIPTEFNCSATTSYNELTNITLNIWNSTGDLNYSNTTAISGFSNSTTWSVAFSDDGTYYWNCEATNNITDSKTYDSNNTVYISTTAPAINLDYPINTYWLDSGDNIYFNFTATDPHGLDTCQLWGNFTGTWEKNYTWYDPVSATMNWTQLNLTDDSYIWNIWCNDSLGNGDFSPNNYTFYVDTVYPSITLGTITTTAGSQTISFLNNVSDANLDSCKYSIFNSTGQIDGTNENVSFTCNTETSATVTAYGTYNLTIYAIDYAENENSSTDSFTTTVGDGNGGGGGGGGEDIERIPTIALQEIAGERVYEELERAIFYARINTFCSIQQASQTLAVQDFSGECSLKRSDIETISSEIAQEGFMVSVNDLILFYDKYNARELEQVYMTSELIAVNELFTSVLGITNPMRVNPPRLDRPFIITSVNGNITIEQIFVVNKDIRECLIISGEGFECEVISSNSVKMTLRVNDTDFFDEIFRGEMSITSEAEPESLEIKRIVLLPRIYNLTYSVLGIPAFWILVLLGILLLALSIFFILRTRLQKELKRRIR